MTDTPIPAPDLRAQLLALAIQYHKVQEGEYGCNGLTCPGVQRLLAFAEAAAALARPRVPEGREAPPQSVPAQIEAAFRAGYHCQWHDGQYVFDPALSPGDPDGAWAAWQHRAEKAEALAIVQKAPVIAMLREALKAIEFAARGDAKGECWTIRQWLDAHGAYNEDIQGAERLIELACKRALAEADAPTEPRADPHTET